MKRSGNEFALIMRLELKRDQPTLRVNDAGPTAGGKKRRGGGLRESFSLLRAKVLLEVHSFVCTVQF